MICKTRKLKNCCSLYILEVLSTWNDIYKSQSLDKDYPSCPLGNPEEKYAHTIFRGPESMGHMRAELNNACFPQDLFLTILRSLKRNGIIIFSPVGVTPEVSLSLLDPVIFNKKVETLYKFEMFFSTCFNGLCRNTVSLKLLYSVLAEFS